MASPPPPTSGAGASDVGVAGALALNVVNAGSRARITGSAEREGRHVRIGGDHRSESSASATPTEDATASGDTLASAPPWRSTSSPTRAAPSWPTARA